MALEPRGFFLFYFFLWLSATYSAPINVRLLGGGGRQEGGKGTALNFAKSFHLNALLQLRQAFLDGQKSP